MTGVLFVRPPTYRRGMRRGWNPWRALRARDHITFRLADVASIGGGGLYAHYPDGDAIILIDPALGPVDRNAALAHELVHDERGGIPVGAPAWIVRKEERQVDEVLALRLVPLEELERFCLARATVGPVSVHDVAEEFEVPPDVAARAMRMLRRAG